METIVPMATEEASTPLHERWTPAPGAPGYEVSSCGAVRNTKSGRTLVPWRHRSGHVYVNLGRRHREQVHRLVLVAFAGPAPSRAHECRHLNGRHDDNRAENLAWGTRMENVSDTVRMGKNHRGETHSAAKLKESDVLEICRKVDAGERYEDIARAYGIGSAHVCSIAQGERWGWLTKRSPAKHGARLAARYQRQREGERLANLGN